MEVISAEIKSILLQVRDLSLESFRKRDTRKFQTKKWLMP